jgi:hypothetical protein
MGLGQHKRGRRIRMEGESATTSSGVSSKRRGTGREATHLMENINLSSP